MRVYGVKHPTLLAHDSFLYNSSTMGIIDIPFMIAVYFGLIGDPIPEAYTSNFRKPAISYSPFTNDSSLKSLTC